MPRDSDRAAHVSGIWKQAMTKRWPIYFQKGLCGFKRVRVGICCMLEVTKKSLRSEIVIEKHVWSWLCYSIDEHKGNNEVHCNLSWCPCKVCSKQKFLCSPLATHRILFSAVQSHFHLIRPLMSAEPALILDQGLGAFFQPWAGKSLTHI